MGLNVLHKVAHPDFERIGKSPERPQGNILLAPFNTSEINGMKLRRLGQLLQT